jgi:nitrate/nitrite transporter NarK
VVLEIDRFNLELNLTPAPLAGRPFTAMASELDQALGSVTGLVGAAGSLLPPIVMGLVYQATGEYAIGLMLLSDVALAGLVFTAWRLRSGAEARAAGRAG